MLQIKTLVLTTLISNFMLMAETDIQTEIYDAAEEMIRFDEKMNKLIAEHNQIDEEEYNEMLLNDIAIEDFEEKEHTYELQQKIEDKDNTKIEVKLVDGLLTILTINSKRTPIMGENNNETGYETTTSSSSVSLLIPSDADKNQIVNSYENGLLKIILTKK